MEHKTCTVKELYEYFKTLDKEDYKLYFECLTVNGAQPMHESHCKTLS